MSGKGHHLGLSYGRAEAKTEGHSRICFHDHLNGFRKSRTVRGVGYGNGCAARRHPYDYEGRAGEDHRADSRWHDDDLSCLRSLNLSNFEPVNVSSLIVNTSSGQTAH